MQEHDIKINLPGLLRLLGSNIYSEPDVAVREMIQNAHDTCIIRHGTQAPAKARIDICFDSSACTLMFTDNGMGMTEDELHKYLSTIGEGFTKVQKDRLRGSGAAEALLLIGQFGIGMLSAFSVADRVEVYTRSSRADARGFRWVCAGDIHYTVEPWDIPEAGTRVLLHLTDTSLVLLDDTRLRQAIKKYADFLSIPIYLKGSQINSCTPPWIDSSAQDSYADYIKARYDLYPLAVLPFAIPDPLPLDGLLFVPLIPFELTRDFGEVDVYVSRMFIKANDKMLLPPWARFFKGIINTPALMPTVSRDELVRDANYTTVCAMLGEIILQYLAVLQKDAPDTLTLVVRAYNNTIKARCVDDEVFFDRICGLVQMNTSDGFLSMEDYLKRSNGVIYYFSERGASTQHKLLFAHKGLPVIDASWGMEEEFLEKYAARRGVKLERLESGSGIIFKIPETMDEKWHDLERQFRVSLQKEARAVAFEPKTVPAVLVSRPIERDDKKLVQLDAVGREIGSTSAQIRALFQKMAHQKSARDSGSEFILHLNTNNPLMQQLRDINRNETFRLALAAIYNNAIMFAQHFVSAEDAEIMFTTNNSAISTMITSALASEELQARNTRAEIELAELKSKLPQLKSPDHRCCFFAFDYASEENYELLAYLQKYFARPELGIEVLAPAKGMHDTNILKSMYDELYTVHFGLAEISGNNPNVFYEAGLLRGLRRPVLLLRRQGTGAKVPFDVFGDYRIEYELTRRAGQLKFVWLEEELNKLVDALFKMVPELERSPKWHP